MDVDLPWLQLIRIVVDSKILTGKPVVSGTRTSVELVMETARGGLEPGADSG
jgi:uncharacterized protein (DUF433 family)